jgi:hypothetical protein
MVFKKHVIVDIVDQVRLVESNLFVKFGGPYFYNK